MNLSVLCSQMWYTAAHKANLLAMDLIPFLFNVEESQSIKSSEEDRVFDIRQNPNQAMDHSKK